MKPVFPKLTLAGWLVAGLCLAHGGPAPIFRMGAGLGNSFGIMGGGLEMEAPDFSLLVGAGVYEGQKADWDIGMRRYFQKVGSHYRSSVTLSYAPVELLTYYAKALDVDKTVVVMGPCFLAGLDQDVGSPGGFIVIYGVGLGYPVFNAQVRKDFQNAGSKLPSQDVHLAFSWGLKFQL